MLIATESDVTAAVLAEAARTPDPRLRGILLPACGTCTPSCARPLTEAEFQQDVQGDRARAS